MTFFDFGQIYVAKITKKLYNSYTKKEKRNKMKDIIDKFVKSHKDFKLYISYGSMRDIGLWSETFNYTQDYAISTLESDFFVSEDTVFYRDVYKDMTESFVIGKNKYIYNPNKANFKDDEFFLIFNSETGDFKVFGNPNRAKIIKALTRLDNIIKGFKFIDKYKSKGYKYLDNTFSWLSFSMQGPNKEELHFDSHSYINGFCIFYPNGVWEIDSSIDKNFERAMKRVLKYK